MSGTRLSIDLTTLSDKFASVILVTIRLLLMRLIEECSYILGTKRATSM